jgi:glycosyltransferase involved in cell wall biosynthesis
MRVLHVIESMSRGGAERNLATLLPAFETVGIENVVATLWAGHAYDDVLARCATRYDMGLRPGPAFSAFPGLVRLARTVDVVHTQLPWADIVGRMAAVTAGKPSLTTVHSTQYDPDNLVRLTRAVRAKFQVVRALDAVLARTTRHFFAVSPAVRDSYLRALHLRPERVEVAPCVLDPRLFGPERQPPRAELRSGYGMAPDEVAILTVGRLIPSKRQEDAIRAVAQISRSAPARLYLAGTGPEETRLRALASELSCPVVFLGEREDIPQLLHAADIFVFPTLFEGMPVALLEAMAMGKACVCSDLIEIRQLGGEALRYFPPQDAAAMARALAALVDQAPLRATLGSEARAAATPFADPHRAALTFLRGARRARGESD